MRICVRMFEYLGMQNVVNMIPFGLLLGIAFDVLGPEGRGDGGLGEDKRPASQKTAERGVVHRHSC